MKCLGCGKEFGGLTGFEVHRIGDHAISEGENRRRCRTDDELLSIGYELKNGKWVKPMPEEYKNKLNEGKK